MYCSGSKLLVSIFLNFSATVPHCGLPESTENGYFVLQATIPGSKVMYGCDDGFELIGSDTRTCGTNEQWSGSAPRCRRK